MKFQFAHPPGFPAPAQEFISDTEREEFDDNDEQPSFPLALFVYNLPTVEQSPEKEEKLMNAITRKFSKHFGTSTDKPGFEVEIRFKGGLSYPCAIVRFKNEKLFRTACKDTKNGGLNSFEFGSKNVLK